MQIYKNLQRAFLFIILCTSCNNAQEKINLGTLIFHDEFERNESQEIKDEVGNNWTTSSDRTAKGYKQVDLKDGQMHVYTHKEANHATSVRHEMLFKDGAIELRFKFNDPEDMLVLNFADLECKEVRAGHIINLKIKNKKIELHDLKTGLRAKAIHKAFKEGKLTEHQKEIIKSRTKEFPFQIELNKWYTVLAVVEGEKITAYIDGKEIGDFSSKGIAHDTKRLLRLLVHREVIIDDVKIWRKR